MHKYQMRAKQKVCGLKEMVREMMQLKSSACQRHV